MSYQELFQRYGRPSKEADIRINTYLLRPDSLVKPQEIDCMDKQAAITIEACRATIERLQDYRKALAERYSQLETMAYSDCLELERYPGYNGITYYVRIIRTYSDKTTIETLTERFDGKERHKAIKRFNQLKKERPGIASPQESATCLPWSIVNTSNFITIFIANFAV